MHPRTCRTDARHRRKTGDSRREKRASPDTARRESIPRHATASLRRRTASCQRRRALQGSRPRQKSNSAARQNESSSSGQDPSLQPRICRTLPSCTIGDAIRRDCSRLTQNATKKPSDRLTAAVKSKAGRWPPSTIPKNLLCPKQSKGHEAQPT